MIWEPGHDYTSSLEQMNCGYRITKNNVQFRQDESAGCLNI